MEELFLKESLILKEIDLLTQELSLVRAKMEFIRNFKSPNERSLMYLALHRANGYWYLSKPLMVEDLPKIQSRLVSSGDAKPQT